ncbi:MAG: SDR family NAD(P)-dependent oxidoreductase, partial [Candidatus Heimdallarchaeota archaeon]|nr:SDR family NAD(P)-dependent oxidoreductase [Candidatus Heimdallarchaeota archaeon]
TITEKNQITNEDLILVLGGGRGITFECIKRLCQKSKPKLALFGIEKLPEDMDEVVWYSDEMLKVKKQDLKVELQSKHEKVTPVILEREWQRFLSQIEVAKNMLYLYERDIEANFYSVDVRNVNSIQAALEQVKEDFDIPITVLVHAAGLEESKSFKKKKIEKSRIIVSVKVEGIWNVLNNIDQTHLRRVICFSSIAGRFGNTGQIDYSFANGYLSRMCWMLSQKGIPSLAINWSAWADIGMATKGSILDILQSVGITPIPPKEGTKKFVELLEKDIDNEVIVAGKLGFMTENEQEIAKPPSDDFPMTDKIVQNNYPMIDTTYQKEGKTIGNRILSFQNDLFMQDHQIQNIPIFPGVMGLETFAEMFKIIKNIKPKVFNDIGFNLAIKQQKKEDKEILVEYNPEQERFSVKTSFTPKVKNAKTIEKEHFVASIKESKELPKAKQLKILERKTSLLTKSDIYDIYFHGKSFQVIDELQEIRDNTVFAKISIPQFPLFKNKDQQLEINPLAVEAALQTAGLYDLIINKQFSLPSTIKKLTILNKASPAYAKAEFVKSDKTTSYFNVWITDKEGNVIIILDKLGMIHTRIPLDFEESIKNKIEETFEYYQINSQFSDKKVRIVPISTITAIYEKEPNVVESWLVAYEKTRYSRITNQKRKIEYIAGVLAAKELFSTVSEFEDYKEIEIKKQPKGQPFFYSRKDKKKSDWNLSISHSGKYAIAAISKDPIGIDIEKIEERKPSFYEEAFTENERKSISEDKILGTQYWTVKEAVSKALGEGLNMKLHDIKLSKGGKEKEFSVDFVSKVKDSLEHKINSFIIENKLGGEYSISICEIKQDGKNDEEKEV